MKKDILRTIKKDMQAVRHNKKDVQRQIKAELAELEASRKEELAENESVTDFGMRAWFNRQVNERYDLLRLDVVMDVYDCWHNDQMYYLIYKDGSDVCISAEEILSGEPFPKMSDIVYAEMSSAGDYMDTETGKLDWYSDERIEACGGNYDDEDEHKWRYETAIQFKFGTAWSARWSRKHPEFVPITV